MSNSLFLLSAVMAICYCITIVTCQTPVPTTCREYSASCARCNLSPLNCRYVWTREGTFNSSQNGTCLSQEVVDQLLWYNEYNKTVYAYALKEEEVNSPKGQYLLAKKSSFQLYNSEAVTCWDRHLCYCKPPAPAPPNRISVFVYDCRTGLPINGASVNLTGTNLTAAVTKTVNSSGLTEYFPLPSGSYFVSVSNPGYSNNGSDIGILMYNETRQASICLNELPCALTVLTFDSTTNASLPGVTVTLNSGSLSPQTTDEQGRTSYSFNSGVASSATGVKAGYTSATESFTCGRNGSVTVRLYLTPIPGAITVCVYDARTRLPIPGANAALSGASSRANDVGANGCYQFTPLQPGFYNANATASGYLPNGTVVGQLELNQTRTVDIYLAEIPCTVITTVYDRSTNLTVNGATVTINSDSQTTGANGQVTFVFNYDVANSVSATKVGYTSASETFTCGRNRTVNVNLWIEPVLNTLIVLVRDIRTNAPIGTATVSVSGLTGSTRTVDAAGSVTYQGVPAGSSYVASASAPGYTSNSTNVPELTFNQTITVVIYLAEIPCTVIVTVRDRSNNQTLEGASVSVNAASIPAQNTPANGQVTFSFNYDAATGVTATKIGYTTESATFTCARNRTERVDIWLSPVLNTLIVFVRDIRTNALITTASVAVSGFAPNPRAVDASGSVTYQGVPAGSNYVASASAPGYQSNSTNVPELTFNQTITVTIYLAEQPCIVTVVTRDNSTGELLSDVEVTLNGTGSNRQTTGASGTVTFSILYDAASGVSGTKTGYTSAFDTFTCSRNGNVTVTLLLNPLPNTIIVQVRDAEDESLITTATVSLTGGSSFSSSQAVDVNATAYFYQIKSGTYFANASAPQYAQNGTSVGAVTFDQVRFVIIYLRKLPCDVIVTVYELPNGTILPNAFVQFSGLAGLSQVYTTNAEGQVAITQGAEDYSNVDAFKAGYRNGTDIVSCIPGQTVEISLFLERFYEIRIAAVDTFTSGRPLIRQATIVLNGTAVTQTDPTNPAIKIQEVSVLPVVYEIQGIAKGYLQQQINTTFSANRLSYNISLSPKQFTLGFGIGQLWDDGTVTQFSTGQITSGFQPGAGTTYQPKPGDLGGEAVQDGTPPKPSAFAVQSFMNVTEFLALFPDILPTSVSPFYIQNRTISLLAPNWNSSVGSTVLMFVPNFDQIEERELKFLLPYRLNSGFLIVRVTPYNTAGTAPAPFTGQFCAVQLFLRGSQNYQNLNALTSNSAAFEFLVSFGSHVDTFVVQYAEEIFDATRSNWVNPANDQVYPKNQEVFNFDWPTPDFLNRVFTTVGFNGQWARKKNSQIYNLYDYRLFYLTKKRTTKN